MLKNLHLLISATVVILAAIVYGGNPSAILPYFFDFSIENLELKNIFRAVMGLYLSFAAYWIVGILQPKHWKNATLSNIIFMGGLSFGRILSTILDGVSFQFSIALFLELAVMIWGIWNLKKLNVE